MRSLTSGRYTPQQIADRLPEDYRFGIEGDIIDRHGNVVETLPASAPDEDGFAPRDAGILVEPGSQVTVNIDADIKMDARVTMRPFEPARDRPFQYRLRLRAKIGMPDGGFASFTLGSFVIDTYVSTARRVAGGGVEEWWSQQWGDRTYLLEMSGPSDEVFVAEKGERASDVLNRLLAEAGIVEQVAPVDAVLDKTYTWSLTKPRHIVRWEEVAQHFEQIARSESAPRRQRAAALRRLRTVRRYLSSQVVETAEVTWLSIANELCAALGMNSLWFDFDDRPRVEPAKELTGLSPGVVYRDGPGGLLASEIKIDTSRRERRANRVTIRATGESTLPPVTVDADTYHPLHPLARRNCGLVLPKIIDEPDPLSEPAMRARAVKELFRRLGLQTSVQFTSLWHPAHEPFDVIGVAVTGHPIFDQVQALHSNQFTISLDDLVVTHEARRIYQQ